MVETSSCWNRLVKIIGVSQSLTLCVQLSDSAGVCFLQCPGLGILGQTSAPEGGQGTPTQRRRRGTDCQKVCSSSPCAL